MKARLIRLPFDVFRRLCSYLYPRDIANLARTCMQLNDAVISKGHLEQPVFARIAAHSIAKGHLDLLKRLLESHSSLFLQESTCLRMLEASVRSHSEPSAQLVLTLMKNSPKYRHVNLFCEATPGRIKVTLSYDKESNAHRIGTPLLITSFFKNLKICPWLIAAMTE